MLVKVNLLGLLFLQEAVGFDIVSMWSQMGYVAKGVTIAFALIPLCAVGFLITKVLKRMR
jgi:hypothetical protein